MSAINFIKIFRALVNIKELQNFLSRNYAVKVTVNEQNWHLIIEFFKNVEIIDRKNVILNLFRSSLFDKIQ